MRIRDLLKATTHRPWDLPEGKWKYYQEWNNAVFLHWKVDIADLRKFVPEDLEIDLFEGRPWVSLVAFTDEQDQTEEPACIRGYIRLPRSEYPNLRQEKGENRRLFPKY